MSNLEDWATEQLKKITSMRWRRKIAQRRVTVRLLTARFRVLPNVVIIGGQRCGTSSLFKYLGRHPEAEPSLRKETQYFTSYADRGENWYRAHFPLSTAQNLSRTKVWFEATPDYLLDARCARRVSTTLGDVKIIALLRNPIERAFSHYYHNRRLGTEPLPLEDALDAEETRLAEPRALLSQQPDVPLPKQYSRFSYVTRGLYAEQLVNWFELFPRSRMLVLSSEDFFQNPGEAFNELTSFLGLSRWSPAEFKNYSYVRNSPKTQAMPANIRERLHERFREPNQQLFELLGQSFDW